MKLRQALELINEPANSQDEVKSFFLACGFSPLHMRTFFQAHLQIRFPRKKIEVRVDLYGDLAGNVERALSHRVDAAAVVVEWADLDPRLGIRQLGGWLPKNLPDILANVRLSLQRLETALNRLAESCPVALSMPTL